MYNKFIYLKAYHKKVVKLGEKRNKTKNHMGKIAISDLHLNGNFIFGNLGQLGQFLVQLT